MKHAKLVAKFKAEVLDHLTTSSVEEMELDPFGMTFGWAMAQGRSVGQAYDFALYMLYDLNYLNAI